MSSRSALLFSALLLSASPLTAQGVQTSRDTTALKDSATTQAAPAPKADGDWTGTIENPGSTMPFSLMIRSHNDTLSGVIRRSTGDLPLTGTISGDTLSFSYTVDYNGSPFTVALQGVLKGDSISGQASYGEGYLLPFNLKRVKADSQTEPQRSKGSGGTAG